MPRRRPLRRMYEDSRGIPSSGLAQRESASAADAGQKAEDAAKSAAQLARFGFNGTGKLTVSRFPGTFVTARTLTARRKLR